MTVAHSEFNSYRLSPPGERGIEDQRQYTCTPQRLISYGCQPQEKQPDRQNNTDEQAIASSHREWQPPAPPAAGSDHIPNGTSNDRPKNHSEENGTRPIPTHPLEMFYEPIDHGHTLPKAKPFAM